MRFVKRVLSVMIIVSMAILSASNDYVNAATSELQWSKVYIDWNDSDSVTIPVGQSCFVAISNKKTGVIGDGEHPYVDYAKILNTDIAEFVNYEVKGKKIGKTQFVYERDGQKLTLDINVVSNKSVPKVKVVSWKAVKKEGDTVYKIKIKNNGKKTVEISGVRADGDGYDANEWGASYVQHAIPTSVKIKAGKSKTFKVRAKDSYSGKELIKKVTSKNAVY